MKRIVFSLVLAPALAACAASSHDVAPAALGTPRATADLEALLSIPGPVEVETVVAADWAVERSGLINLDHPTAKAAHLEDGDEPIQIYMHALRHPKFGLFLVDTGVEAAVPILRPRKATTDRSAMIPIKALGENAIFAFCALAARSE